MTSNLQCDSDSNLFHVSLQWSAAVCLSACWKLLTPSHSYSQLSECRIKRDRQSRPEQKTRRYRERLTVSHQNIHHSVECHFHLARGQRMLFAIVRTLCDSRGLHGSYTGIWQFRQITINFASAPAAFSAVIKSCRSSAHSSQITDECVPVLASTNCCVFMSTLRYTEEEIRQKVSTFRQMLMDKEGVITREGSHTQPV